MGDQGRTIHVRLGRAVDGGRARAEPAWVHPRLRGPLGATCVGVLATSERWTSLCPLGHAPLDPRALARATGAVVLEILFEEEVAVDARWCTPDGRQARWHFAVTAGTAWTAAHEKAAKNLIGRGVLGIDEVSRLRAQLAAGRRWATWLLRHGLERLLGLPFARTVPLYSSEEAVRASVHGVVVVGDRRHAVAPPDGRRSYDAPGRDAAPSGGERTPPRGALATAAPRVAEVISLADRARRRKAKRDGGEA